MKATIHLFSARKIEYDTEESDGPPSIESLEKTYPGFTALMKRGDIIENIDESDYRSSTIYFFDGVNIIQKDTSTDDYGSPPLEFELITEFPPGYWDQPYNSESRLPVNNQFEPGKSDFYWHSESAWSPINLEKLGIQGLELKSNEVGFLFIYNGTKCFLLHDSSTLPHGGVLYVHDCGHLATAPEDAICISTTY